MSAHDTAAGRDTSSNRLTDKQVESFYSQWAERGSAFFAAAADGADAVAETRRAYDDFFLANLPPAKGVRYEDAEGSPVPAEWFLPDQTVVGRVVLYFHGGAYRTGSSAAYRGMVGVLARDLGARAFVPNYRLAPESPFPAAIDDGVDAYRWLLDRGVQPERLVIAGDSAGGAMAVSVLVAARDQGLPMPAASIAFSPWANLEHTGSTMSTRAGIDPSVDKEGLSRAADMFLDGVPANSPLASPVFADTRGLPPTLIQIGEREVMLSDAVRLAGRLAEDNVPVQLEAVPGMGHVWLLFADHYDPADRSMASAVAFADTHLHA